MRFYRGGTSKQLVVTPVGNKFNTMLSLVKYVKLIELEPRSAVSISSLIYNHHLTLILSCRTLNFKETHDFFQHLVTNNWFINEYAVTKSKI